MDPSGGAAATRFNTRRTPSSSSDRFLGVSTRSRLDSSVSGTAADELTEDDVFWTGDFAEHNNSSTAPPTSSTSPSANHQYHQHGKGIGRAENFGILAALPATDSDHTRSVFNHKASVSPSSSASSTASSSRMMIPMVPKKPPPPDRQGHQSAPVNVPVMTEAMRRSQATHQFDAVDDYNDDGEGDGGEMMLPPHEVVASRQSPMVAYSVLEGVGRTLKGRDLRQVRNAVWRKTGFLD